MGVYETPEEGARVHDAFMFKHGELGKLYFPEEWET
jgi:hypothetical protein